MTSSGEYPTIDRNVWLALTTVPSGAVVMYPHGALS